MTLLAGGLAIGGIYALVAMGTVLVYRATGIVNFAQGGMLMFGAYAYVQISQVTGSPLLQFVVVTVIGVATGLVFFAVTHGLMRGASELVLVIGTLALLIIMETSARIGFTDTPRPVGGWLVGGHVYALGGVRISASYVVVVAFTLVIGAALHLFFQQTRYGKAVRSVAEAPVVAAMTGIPVAFMLGVSWCLGGALAAIGGMLLSPITLVFPTMWQGVLFASFVAAVLGGLGSLAGSLLGGFAVGLLQTYAVDVVGGTFRNVAVFTVLLAVLLIRPSGLFADRQVRAF